MPVALPADGTCSKTPQMFDFTANKTTIWCCASEVAKLWCLSCLMSADSVEMTVWLTFLTVVKLVKLTGFGLALAEDQVVSDITIRVVGRFPL